MAGASLLIWHMQPALAQTPPAWGSIPYRAMGEGVAACTHASGQGDVFCFGLRCAASGGAAEWFTYQVGGDSVEGEARVNLVFDGQRHATLFMAQEQTPMGEWSFSTAHEPSRDSSVLAGLKSGSNLYVIVGGASGAHLSLRGSSRELNRALAMCVAAPGNLAQAPASASAPDSLRFMRERPGCEASEEEIFETLSDAGFGVMGINRAIVGWAVDGTLELVDRTDEIYRYRLADCETGQQASSGSSVEPYPQVAIPLIDEARLLCGGESREQVFDPRAIEAGDINADGMPDYIVKMEHLSCLSGFRPFCGAQFCEVSYFVSSQGGYLSDRVLAADAFFRDDAIAMPCPGQQKVATVRERGGRLVQTGCR